ncbi:MAG: hypothetical protein KAT01_02420, partial [Candidatus Aminicenantes bacterium]|nr:hypothetical protein [Candidatus Aminicenantes bacterium]
MNILIVDYIFLLIAVGLLVVMFFLYKRTKLAMKANIREILEEYKELKQIATELRKDADNHKEQSEAPPNSDAQKKEADDYHDYKLREYIYEVRQKNKADIERAIKKIKEEIKNDLEQKLEQALPKAEAVTAG